MDLTKWLGQGGRRRGRGRGARRADRRRQAPRLEGLEDRRLLSTIVWTNRGGSGNDSDGFDAEFGGNAFRARQVVDQAILAWQNVITNFNHVLFSGDPNRFSLTVRAKDLSGESSSTLAQTDINSSDLDIVGKPLRATIEIDDDATGDGWYFDARPDDNGEFTGLINRFAAGLPNSSPNAGLFDLYGVVLHEIGHSLGISTQVDGLRINDFLTSDPNVPNRKFFNGPTISATMTDPPANGLHFDDTVHRNDLLNPFVDPGDRHLISDLDARVLADAYDYDIALPSNLQSFDANLDKTTGVLTVSGDLGDDFDDDVTVTRLFDSVIVMFEDDTQPTIVRAFPGSVVSEIRVFTGIGVDEINIESVFAGDFVSVDGGTRGDTIRIAGTSGRLDGIDSSVFVNDGFGDGDTLIVNDSANPFAATYTLNSGLFGFVESGVARSILFSGIETVSATGGKAGNTFNVRGTTAGTLTQLVGAVSGPDTFDVGGIGNTLAPIAGQLTVIGRGNNDRVVVHDENHAPASTYSITDSLVARGAARVNYSDVDNVSLRGGRGNNTYNVESTLAGTPVDITAGIGDDSFNITPTAKRLTDIAGLLTVAGGSGSDQIDILDRAPAAAGATYSLSGSLLSRNGKTHVSQLGFEELDYFGNDRNNTYDVEAVDAATDVDFFGGAGDDRFRLTPTSRNLGAIGRSVTFIGGNGFDTVTADDGANAAAATYRYDSTFLNRNGKGVADANAGIDEVVVFSGSGANAFDVERTVAEIRVKLFGGNGDDTFRLAPQSKNLTNIGGSVSFIGGNGFNTLSALDFNNAAGATYRVNDGFLSRNGKGIAEVNVGINEVIVFAGNGVNTFDVEGTRPENRVKLFGGNANDTFRLTPQFRNLNSIGSSVTFIGGNGFDTVTANDGANASGATYRIDGTFLRRNGKGIADANAGIDSLVVLAGNGANTFDVEQTNVELPVSLNGGTAADTFRIAPTFRNLNTIDGIVTVNGGGGTDSLTLNDSASTAAATWTLDATAARRQVGSATARVNYSAVEAMSILAGIGTDLLTVAAVPSAGNVQFHGGAGSDTLASAVAGSVFTLSGTDAGRLTFPASKAVVDFAATENLRALASSTVRLPDGGRLSGMVDGRGLATLDYATRSTGVIVDLATGTASGTARALGVVTVLGSPLADRITGDAGDNQLLGNGGADILNGGAGRDVLVGGDGNDTIDGGNDRDVIIGGRGADNLRGGVGTGGSVIADGFEDDLLIGGSTLFDADRAALALMKAEWTSAAPYADRVGHLRGTLPGGANAHVFLRTSGTSPTVFDDAIADIVRGESGQDWFLAVAAEAADRQPNELLN